MRLPRRENVVQTGHSDPIASYYNMWAPLMRGRLSAVLALMGNDRYSQTLEIGYGSGILLPELAQRTSGKLWGVDRHDREDAVKEMLRREGITSEIHLARAEGSELPLSDHSIDLVVAVSLLEHVEPAALDSVLVEIERVTTPGATLCFGFPTRNVLMSWLARAYGWDYDREHPSSENDILAALDRRFRREALTPFPRIPVLKPLYYAACYVRV